MSQGRDLTLELIQSLHRRREKGIATYGKPVDPDAKSVEFWLSEGIDEALDWAQYSSAALECVRKMKERITELEEKLADAQDENRELQRRLEGLNR